MEYYFAGDLKQVTFPWDNGITVDAMEKYYDDIGFVDWTHAVSKAPMLKAQHPDYETWMLGVHGKNGVTCIDCHMPKVQAQTVKSILTIKSVTLLMPLNTLVQTAMTKAKKNYKQWSNHVKPKLKM